MSNCDAKIARNQTLKKSMESKIAEIRALKMIPISSCIEVAEGFLTSISEADGPAIHKLDSEKEGIV